MRVPSGAGKPKLPKLKLIFWCKLYRKQNQNKSHDINYLRRYLVQIQRIFQKVANSLQPFCSFCSTLSNQNI
jgi:ABC-type dipeptide/oligopeptide/nickel transport system ATPase subunit